MNVFELYSGIGGMHWALLESGLTGRVVAAADINTTANLVYKHNFPQTQLFQRNIQSFTAEDFVSRNVNLIMMSPPCQPYTRLGLQKDDTDNRSDSLMHIIEILPTLKTVNYILLENVKGFETSRTRDRLVEALTNCDFQYQEFLLSPVQFSIPNSRLRYYLLAKKSHLPFCFALTCDILQELPEVYQKDKSKIGELCNKFHNKVEKENSCFSLVHILGQHTGLLLSDTILSKHSMILDIVDKDSTHSCCFTKGYTHYIEGTGSVFTPKTQTEVTLLYKQAQQDGMQCLKDLELRFFSPTEIANLMCFPDSFTFPSNVSDKQRYRLLGNSINVHVVAILTRLLVSDE